jgi:hypothetical protein
LLVQNNDIYTLLANMNDEQEDIKIA